MDSGWEFEIVERKIELRKVGVFVEIVGFVLVYWLGLIVYWVFLLIELWICKDKFIKKLYNFIFFFY